MPVPTDAFIEAIADAVCKRLRPLLEDVAKPVQQKLLSTKAAATYMGRSRSTVLSMITKETIPPIAVKRIGRNFFLVREHLDRWLNAQ